MSVVYDEAPGTFSFTWFRSDAFADAPPVPAEVTAP